MGRSRGGGRAAKPRPANYEVIPEGQPPYRVLDEARRKWHRRLDGARILLAWKRRTKADKDGHLVLGKCVKVGALQRELVDADFIIVLNREVWEAADFKREKQLALVDHELCHAAPVLAKDGSEVKDERGRQLWRCRKHDIEEFRSVVEHHGTYKADLVEFAKALLKKAEAPLLAAVEEPGKRPEATV